MFQTLLDNKLIAADVQEKVTESASFIDHVVIDDAFALTAARDKKVAVPQAGALPDVKIDDTSNLTVDTSLGLKRRVQHPKLPHNHPSSFDTSKTTSRTTTNKNASPASKPRSSKKALQSAPSIPGQSKHSVPQKAQVVSY